MRIIFVILLCNSLIIADAIDTNSSFLESKALVLQEMFSYAVSLRKPHSLHLEGEHFCAGFLLLDQNVISTARCLYKISEIECPLYDDVFAVTGAVEFGLGIRHNIKYLEVHENYNKNGNFENDIALITLENRVDMMPHHGLYNLPIEEAHSEMKPLLVGWGTLNEPQEFKILASLAKIVDKQECKFKFSLKDGQLCVALLGKQYYDNFERGDPLDNVDRKEIIGILSVFDKSDYQRQFRPSIFTDIYYFRDWILKTKEYGDLIPSRNAAIESLRRHGRVVPF